MSAERPLVGTKKASKAQLARGTAVIARVAAD